MFERLLKLYLEERITIQDLDAAVEKGWITEEQKELIIGSN